MTAVAEQHLLDVADALVKRGIRNDMQRFVDEALVYVEALGVTCDRASIEAAMTRRLRRHGYFSDERAVATTTNVDEHVDVEAATPPPPPPPTTTSLELTLNRLVTQLRERILSDAFLADSNPARSDEFFVLINIVYSQVLHEPLVKRLRETYTAAAAEHKPLRPIFLSPFIKNVEQCRLDRDRDVCATLFFRFAGDPRSAIFARRNGK